MNPSEFCTERAAPPGSSVYYATLFHSPPDRRVLHACFAFLEEICRDLSTATDPTPAGRRLLWWREQLEAGPMATSPHPIMVEMRALTFAAEEISRCLEPAIISALEELAGWQPEADAQWRSHCHALHAGLWQLAARGCATATDAGVTDRIGAIAAWSGQLQQVLELAPRTAAGRCPLPRTLLQSHGLDTFAGPGLLSKPGLPAAVREAVSEMRRGLIQCATPGTEFCKGLPLFCRVLHLINLTLCAQLQRQPELLLTQRVALTPLRKLWIAWRQRASRG